VAREGDLVSVADDLRALLARHDDAAFEALANRGLLRRARKDLEKAEPAIVGQGATVDIRVGDRLVKLDARGPAHAQCDCAAPEVCLHILAACLWLKGTGAAPGSTSDAASTQSIDQLHADLMSFDTPALEKWSGVPGYRWALELVGDLEDPESVRIAAESNVVVSFAHPRFSCRYVGGGLDSAIVDLSISDARKYVVAAVIAYQRANGRPLPAPPERRRAARALDLGKDHELASDTMEHRAEARAKVMASAEQLLLDCLLTGLSHLSAASAERFTTLAVGAQGAELHRLALLLRRLADHVEMLLHREAGADEAQLLDDLALAHALLAALHAAKVDAGEDGPRRLVGEARSAYETAGSLELFGLGAYPWRSASGYLGLTLLFRGATDGQWYTWSESRPEIQRGFDPVVRYKSTAPWGGIGTPQQLVGKRFTLIGAQANRFGRLSSSRATTAAVAEPFDAAPVLRDAVTDWSELESRLRANGGTLDERDPRSAWCVVRPAVAGNAQFEATEQALWWPLHDKAGRVLACRLAFSEMTAHAIARIESIGPAAAGKGVVVRLARMHGRLIAEPMSIVQDAPDPVDAIYFDPGRDPGRLERWKAALQSLAGKPEAADIEPSSDTWRYLEPLDAETLRLAERGLMELPAAAMANLESRLRSSADAGFLLPQQLWTAASAGSEPRTRADALLRVRHALRALQTAL
jgi:hypothetical protein